MILDHILQNKKLEIETLPTVNPAELQPSNRSFLQAIRQTDFAIIGEIKSRSPSEGIICEDFHPAEIAKSYEDAGINALSVLTDQPFFGGSYEDLQTARAACNLPAMCKEFILDEKQIYQARLHGADAVLLIVRILSDTQLKALKSCIESFNMTALIEIFDEEDCSRALAVNPQVIGINNRNLDTLEMDMDNAKRLKPLISSDISIISLSGVRTPANMEQLSHSFDGVLAGTALMRAENPSDYCAFKK